MYYFYFWIKKEMLNVVIVYIWEYLEVFNSLFKEYIFLRFVLWYMSDLDYYIIVMN